MNNIKNYFENINFKNLAQLCEQSFNSQLEVHMAVVYGLITGKNAFTLEPMDDSYLFKLKDEILELLDFNDYDGKEWHFFYDVKPKANKIILNSKSNVIQFLSELGDNDIHVLNCSLSLAQNIKIQYEKDLLETKVNNKSLPNTTSSTNNKQKL